MHTMNKVMLTLLVITLTACSNKTEVRQHLDARKTYWQNEIAKLPIGADENTVQKWFEARSLEIKPYDNAYTASLDPIDVTGELLPVCKSWFIHLNIQMDENQRVSKKAVREQGLCL